MCTLNYPYPTQLLSLPELCLGLLETRADWIIVKFTTLSLYFFPVVRYALEKLQHCSTLYQGAMVFPGIQSSPPPCCSICAQVAVTGSGLESSSWISQKEPTHSVFLPSCPSGTVWWHLPNIQLKPLVQWASWRQYCPSWRRDRQTPKCLSQKSPWAQCRSWLHVVTWGETARWK